MRIKVTFDNAWTKEEVKEYLSVMDNERYRKMDYDVRLELAACAYIYSNDPDITQDEMNYFAQEDIAVGIDEFFFSEMCDNYISAYDEESKENTTETNERSLR